MERAMEGLELGGSSTPWVDEDVNEIPVDDDSSEEDFDDECVALFGMEDEVDDELGGEDEVDDEMGGEDEVDECGVEEQVEVVKGTGVDGMEDIGQIDWKSLTPKDVMMYHFSDNGVAFMFYNHYGRFNGFGARKSKVLRNKNGEIIQQLFVCNRQGYREERNRNRENRKREPKHETRCGCEAKMKVHVNGESGRWHVIHFCDDHNHEMLNDKLCKMLAVHRRMTDDDIAQMMNMRKVGISTPQIYGCFGNRLGGFDKIGFRKKDMYNEVDRQRRLQYCDAQAAVTHLRGLTLNDPGLFWSHTIDSEGRLEHLFWADGMCRMDYELFGDVLAFDATYRKNKYCCPVVIFLGVNHHYKSTVFGCGVVSNETEETYVWLLEQFLLAMKDKAPMSVITDGDVAMKNATSKVFPNAHHRLCAWHLQRNAKTHIHNPGFTSEFTRCMMGDYEVSQFEKRWSKMIDKYELGENAWIKEIYEKRRMWATAYIRGNFFGTFRTTSRCEGFNSQIKRFAQSRISLVEFIQRFGIYLSYLRHKEHEDDFASVHGDAVLQTNVPVLERHAANVFTKDVFLLFRPVLARGYLMKVVGYRETSSCFIYFVSKYLKPGKVWQVLYDPESVVIKCSCKRLESFGLPCDHIIGLLIYLDMDELPKCVVLDRWTKSAKESVNSSLVGGSDYCESNLLARYDSLVFGCREMCKLAYLRLEDYNETSELVRTQTEKLKEKNAFDNVNENNDHVVDGEMVKDPARCRYKGCGSSTSTQRGKGKSQRCGNCGGIGHNRKTCTSKKLVNLTSQSDYDASSFQANEEDGNLTYEDRVMDEDACNLNDDV